MKLTYWVAKCLDDHPCYNIREKTKKAVLANKGYDRVRYSAPKKVEIEYNNGLDLLTQCLSEGGAYWE